jgi:galactofuranose transport system ATP-binding protein
MTKQTPLLEMSGIQKSFPGVRALEAASLRVERGEVHALVGQNGAGKSTLIKILTGAYTRDAGEIRFGGSSVNFSSPQAAQNAGIATIYQEVNLVALRSVAENIFLGREPRRFAGLMDWKRLNHEAAEILARFNVSVDVTRPLGMQNIAVQQMTAIARAVSLNAKLVVMDESTSSLDEREVSTLFGVIRQLRDTGVSVIFISHRLDELYAVCDRVTIMRDGQTVLESSIAQTDKLSLVARMLGKDLKDLQGVGQTAFTARAKSESNAAPLLELKNLQRGQRLRGVSVAVNAGEIVGLAGLLGAGRTETARVAFGADKIEGGELVLAGQATRLRSPIQAIGAGFGFCSEDRKIEGIIPDMSVRENLTLALLPQLARSGVVDIAKQSEIVTRFIDRLGIKTSNPEQPVRELSGGNQQKVLLARWLCMNPKLLILDEPTRGIDVGAKGEIQSLIEELARDGLGVLMISSELEELSEGCDRIVVLRDGASVATLEGDGRSQAQIMTAMAHGDASSQVAVTHG